MSYHGWLLSSRIDPFADCDGLGLVLVIEMANVHLAVCAKFLRASFLFCQGKEPFDLVMHSLTFEAVAAMGYIVIWGSVSKCKR